MASLSDQARADLQFCLGLCQPLMTLLVDGSPNAVRTWHDNHRAVAAKYIQEIMHVPMDECEQVAMLFYPALYHVVHLRLVPELARVGGIPVPPSLVQLDEGVMPPDVEALLMPMEEDE